MKEKDPKRHRPIKVTDRKGWARPRRDEKKSFQKGTANPRNKAK